MPNSPLPISTMTRRLYVVILCYLSVLETASAMCPTNCNCTGGPRSSKLIVDCQNGMEMNPEELSQQLDSLLSGNLTYGGLTSLGIFNSPLRHVPRSVCRLTTLTSLRLDHNGLIALPDNCFGYLTNLSILGASNNAIGALQDGVFDGLLRLELLDLSDNNISSIGLGVFAVPSRLDSLYFLNMINNFLTSLEPWIYDRGVIGRRLGYRVHVWLQGNRISEFTNQMQFTGTCEMGKPLIRANLRYNKIRHYADLVSGWNINVDKLDERQIGCFFDFSIERITINVMIDLEHNEIKCDCVDYHIFNKLRLFHLQFWWLFLDCMDIDPFTKESKVVNGFNLPLDRFVCELTEGCPPGCLCIHIPVNSTLHIYCAFAQLTVLPFQLPELPDKATRYMLDFSNNPLLDRLETRSYFAKASSLDARNSSISTISVQDWRALMTIPKVIMSTNRLTSLPRSVVSVNITSDKLDVLDNPWDCSCDNRWMAHWFVSITDQLTHKQVLCGAPSRLRGKDLLQMDYSDFCVDPVKQALTISMSSVAGVVTVLLIIGSIIYRLRVKLYTKWKFHPFDRDECLGEDMHYDVFHCCSSEDHQRHGMAILQRLEANGYLVCYHLRDFLGGEPISENICNAVRHSKRTVCFLTEHFLKSGYCIEEFNVAYHFNVIEKQKKRLIVLMAMDSPQNLHVDEEPLDTAALRQYVRQYTYINYAADDWLGRLLYALPLRGLKTRAGTDDNDEFLLSAEL